MSEKAVHPDSNEPPPPYGTAGQNYQPPAGTYSYQPPPAGSYNYPPAGEYVAQPPLTATTTVIVTSHVALSPNPVSMQCPHCSSQIVTAINYITGTLTWIVCVILLLFGLWCGCCLIPFCVPECQDVEHRCPNCNRVVGVYRRV